MDEKNTGAGSATTAKAAITKGDVVQFYTRATVEGLPGFGPHYAKCTDPHEGITIDLEVSPGEDKPPMPFTNVPFAAQTNVEEPAIDGVTNWWNWAA